MEEKEQWQEEIRALLDEQIKRLDREILQFKLYAFCNLLVLIMLGGLWVVKYYFTIPLIVDAGATCFIVLIVFVLMVWKKRLKKLR